VDAAEGRYSHAVRIVSLLPSATEIICAVGLRDRLVAVSHECDHPPGVAELPHLTRTLIPQGAPSGEIDAMVGESLARSGALYGLDALALGRLAPDLVVTQSLCAVCAVAADEVAAACRAAGGPRILTLEPSRLDDVFAGIQEVGSAAGRAAEAASVVSALRARVDAVRCRSAAIPGASRPRVAFLEWIDPLFSGGHWNPELVELAGGDDVLGRAGEPSRRVEWDEVVAADPQVVVVACCGYTEERARHDLPLLTARPGWDDLAAARTGRVHVVDGNAFFSRPGPRLVESLEILAHLLHPEANPAVA
jgi:iron complex transport system substrate-binding protein